MMLAELNWPEAVVLVAALLMLAVVISALYGGPRQR
jgi:hypothetical protein